MITKTKNCQQTLPLLTVSANTGILIKSPLNYIGGKFRILKQILPLFPKDINNFVDLFAGGCNVGINVNAHKIFFNDNLTFLIDMYQSFTLMGSDDILKHIYGRISQLELSQVNEEGYKKLREIYNTQKNPLDLFVLVAYSFNHQIRFNNNHQFNNPFGKNRSSFNETMKKNLLSFVDHLHNKNVVFSSTCFSDFDTSFLSADDFVYCDPPYLITTGTYNDGKRGFKGWTSKEEMSLLGKLDNLHNQGVKFGLSNVLVHKGKTNELLKDWLTNNNHYKVHYLKFDYSNSNYHTKIRDKDSSKEVLITNY